MSSMCLCVSQCWFFFLQGSNTEESQSYTETDKIMVKFKWQEDDFYRMNISKKNVGLQKK